MRLALREPHSRTLMGRVAFVAALAALGGGFFAAIAAVSLAEGKVESAEDRRLTEEASEIAHEVAGLTSTARADHLVAEAGELARVGLRFAVHRDGSFIGGDAHLPLFENGCFTREVRMCVVKNGPWSCIVAADDVPTLGRGFMLGIVGGAAIVAALLGALASRRLARWAIAPLVRLGERVGDAPMDQATDLGADENILEIDALRKTLRELLDRRAEALRLARLFAAGAAHELRTPLTTLSGELELLSEETLPEPIQDRIAALRGSTGRIVQLVEKLLILARMGASEAMRHDAVELADVLEEVCRQPGARLTCETRSTPMVRGDETLLSVMCENAIHNALVHATPGKVKVVLDELDNDACIDVIDEGPGVGGDERDRLFEPFQRGTTSKPGVGLGLALVRRIAEAHGGRAMFIDCERGAHLRILLPQWAPRRIEDCP